jgi:hypothetical protein
MEGLQRRLDRQVQALNSVDDEMFAENIGIAECAPLSASTGPRRQTM